VTCAANAFLATLTTAQRTKVILPHTAAAAVRWSNLPCGLGCRNGLEFSTLTAVQLKAAKAVVAAVTGSDVNNGWSEVQQIMAADDVLKAAGNTQRTGGTPPAGAPGGPGVTGTPPAGAPSGVPGSTPPAAGTPPPSGGGGSGGYSSGLYDIAFLGTPSATGTWQLQFGGHHLAINTTFRQGKVTGSTPMFEGVEPKCWTVNSKTSKPDANTCALEPGSVTSGGVTTTTYAPLSDEHDRMKAMLASLSSTQLANARLSQTFSDVLLGPGQDGKFPTNKQGVAVKTLTQAQQALVLTAMKSWVQDTDAQTASALIAVYTQELENTYVSYSGNADLSSNADYVRIDGPSVWIEFVCQNGVVYSSQIHYHSVWRDHTRDYGASFAF